MRRSVVALMVSSAALTGYFFGGLNMTASAHPACVVSREGYWELVHERDAYQQSVVNLAKELQELKTKYHVVEGQD